MTINDLLYQLNVLSEAGHGDSEVRIASRPGWPFECEFGKVVGTEAGVVYLSQGDELGYLPVEAVELLGWG